jgi:DNA polymerase-3 subunit gamma/tau
MDKFIVSARKYRPQDFSAVVGQSHITTTLKNAIRNNQLAHAFLFCGPRGVGKTTCARILAKTINCENRTPAGEACNRCPSCVSFNEGTSLNIHELDAASNNSVDDIRNLVEQVRFAPQAGQFKVYIIDEVHMLSSSAFNAFLKTLEEPPPYAIFILATTEKHKILPTILSRCQIFDFKRITTADTVAHLREICEKEEIRAEKPALQVIAQKSEGCMRDALSILDKIVSFTNGELTYQNTLEHLNILDADYYFRILDAMKSQDLSQALLLYDDINRKGFEGDLVLNGMAEFIRNLLVCKDERVASLLEAVESFRDRYISAGKTTDTAWLIAGLNLLNEAEINFRSARNKRLHVELALIKLCYLGQAMRNQSSRGQTAENQGSGEPKAVKPVSYRNIPPMELVQSPAGKPASSGPSVPGTTVLSGTPEPSGDGARLIVETPAASSTSMSERSPDIAPTQSSGGTLASLIKIRQQFSSRQQNKGEGGARDLDQQTLEKAWREYSQVLKDQKNPAGLALEDAVLQISAPHLFEVVVDNNLKQKFIEQEKRTLSDHLQKVFANKTISFSVRISDQREEKETGEKPLNKREQFLQMAEQYPLVKELKDRLKLELDY